MGGRRWGGGRFNEGRGRAEVVSTVVGIRQVLGGGKVDGNVVIRHGEHRVAGKETNLVPAKDFEVKRVAKRVDVEGRRIDDHKAVTP